MAKISQTCEAKHWGHLSSTTGSVIKTKKLEDKVTLVAGGSRGMGAAIARRLAEDGADVSFLLK